MKVLVLGGTGAMGVHLVNLLSGNGIDVVVTSRSERQSEGNVRYVQGNARDLEFLRTVLQERWDAIVDFMVYSTADFPKRVNLLLDATSQYVFLSSARVYAESKRPITEDSSRLLDVSQDKEFLSTDEYSLAKARQENILKQSGRENWTIIRPYITYSENRLQLGVLEKEEWLYRALHGRTIVFSSDITAKMTTLTYGLDVSKGMMSLIGKPKALGETFHITAEVPIRWDAVLALYLDVLEKHLGKRPKVKLLDLEAFLHSKPAQYQVKYDRLFDRTFDTSKITDYMDTSRFVQVRDGLVNCLEHFLQAPQFNRLNWVAEALRDVQTGECASLIEIPGFRQKLGYLKRRFLTSRIKKEEK